MSQNSSCSTRCCWRFSCGFAFNCKTDKPEVSMKRKGTMVAVKQHCTKCIKGYVWTSQTYMPHGKYPVGNGLLSFAVLMAGASISKILQVLRHMGLCVYSARTFFAHQRSFLFPTVIHHWESYQADLISTLKNMKDVVWSGDGRFDSMGHSVYKYHESCSFWTCAGMKVSLGHFKIIT